MASDVDVYQKQNFGNTVGFGKKPALLIVDFVNGFNDPNAFGGGNIPEAIDITKKLLYFAREKKLTIAHTRVVFSDDHSGQNIMCKKVNDFFVRQSFLIHIFLVNNVLNFAI